MKVSPITIYSRRLITWVLCAPAFAVAAIFIAGLIFLLSSFAYQYSEKFQTPGYAANFPPNANRNIGWLDSVNSYSIEYRTGGHNVRGKLETKGNLISKCPSVVGIEFLIDSNKEIVDTSFKFIDRKRGFTVNDSLFECDSSELQQSRLNPWKSRIRFLRDTLDVGVIRSSGGQAYFQFGQDLILRTNQKIDFICQHGVMYNEIKIDLDWKILRNCVAF